MLCQLSTVKSRLALADTQFDALLTAAIQAVSARFDAECHRTFARTAGATYEFQADETEILPACYPIESVTKFELKTTESEGWVEQVTPAYLIRHRCIISLPVPISAFQLFSFSAFPAVARVTYTGGYVLPGTVPGTGQTALPADVEQAAVEQVAWWFQKRDNVGLKTIWPHEGNYQQFLQSDLLLEVRAVLRAYARLSL